MGDVNFFNWEKISFSKASFSLYCFSNSLQGRDLLITPSIQTTDADVHDMQGTTASFSGQPEAARLAMWPPIDTPVTPKGPQFSLFSQCSRTMDSSMRQQPIMNKSLTCSKQDLHCFLGFLPPQKGFSSKTDVMPFFRRGFAMYSLRLLKPWSPVPKN